MALGKGIFAPPLEEHGKRERISGKLQPRASHIEALVSGLNLDPQYVEIARRAGKRIWTWRNEHDIARRTGGLFVPDRRIGKDEADKMLKRHLADEAGGVHG